MATETQKYKELPWGHCHVPSRPPLPVVLTSHELCPLLRAEDLGVFDPYAWKIYIYAGQSNRALEVAWVHEMCHAMVYCDGDPICDENEEENVIKALQWSLTESIRKQGWSTPKLPDGLASLAAHARCVRRSMPQ